MKTNIIFINLLLALTLSAFADTWTKKTDFIGYGRSEAVAFSIYGKSYIGTGSVPTDETYGKDIWEYEPDTDIWSQKADIPVGRIEAVGFTIGGKGYIGTGRISSYGFLADFWEFDPTLNIWTKKADFAGGIRYSAVGFSINGKGYIGIGRTAAIIKKDFWEYDPVTDIWTQRANFISKRYSAVGFCIDDKGYIGTGSDGQMPTNDFWEYNPTTNSWNQKANFGGDPREVAIGFSIGSNGYIGIGADFTSYKLDIWEYDSANNIWTKKTDYPGEARSNAIAFSISNKGYVGTGYGINSSQAYLKEFYEYAPDCDSVNVYADQDGDGYGDANSNSIICDSLLPNGFVYDNTDCNDANASINPSAIEVCANSMDDNCDGTIDENCCNTPIGLTTTNLTSTSAQLNWNTVASATKYKVQYKRDSTGTAWTTVTITAPTTTYTVTGLLANSKYKWKVRSVCGSVKSAFSSVIKFTTLLRLGEESVQQKSLMVYPNPIITSSTISFFLNEKSNINIELLDLTGRKIKTLVDDYLEEGNHQLVFNRKQLEAGIYFLKAKINNETSMMKIVIE